FIIPGLACIAGGFIFWHTAHAVRGSGGIRKYAAIPLARPMLVKVVAILLGLTMFGSLIFNATTVVMPKLFEQNIAHLPSGTTGIGLLVCLVFTVSAFAQTFIGGLMDRYSIRAVLLPVVLAQIPFLLLAGHTYGWTLAAAATG